MLRALHQSTLYWITVNIAQLLHALLLAPLFYFESLDPELEIVIACLPEGLRPNIPALRFAIGQATQPIIDKQISQRMPTAIESCN